MLLNVSAIQLAAMSLRHSSQLHALTLPAAQTTRRPCPRLDDVLRAAAAMHIDPSRRPNGRDAHRANLPHHVTALKYASPRYNQFVHDVINNEDLLILYVEDAGMNLQYAPSAMRNNKRVVFAAVQQNGNALQYASDELKNNRDVVFAAVSEDGKAMQFASDSLKGDADIAFAAVLEDAHAIMWALDPATNDFAVVVAAIEYSYGYDEDNSPFTALKYASDGLKDDQGVVLYAVKQNGYALRFASAALKNNEDVVYHAVTQNGNALQFASNGLKASRDVVLAAVASHGEALQFASEPLRGDITVVVTAMNDPKLLDVKAVLRHASPTLVTCLKELYELMTAATSSNQASNSSNSLKRARPDDSELEPHMWRSRLYNREKVLATVRINGNVLEYASDDLQSDPEVVLVAVRQNKNALQYVSPELRDGAVQLHEYITSMYL